MAKPKKRRRAPGSGSLTLLKSGRWQARRPHPTDLLVVPSSGQLRPRMVARSFDAVEDARGWLKKTDEEAFADSPEVVAPAPSATSFRVYADDWLAARDVRPRTRDHYRRLLEQWLYPTFGNKPLSAITPTAVRQWHNHSVGEDGHGATMRAHAYTLLKSVLSTAVDDDVIPSNPCRVKGGGKSPRSRKVKPLTLAEVDALTAAMPARLQAAVQVSVWCAPRFGELVALRRRDVNLKGGTLRIERAVVRVGGSPVPGPPKSDAGDRVVTMPTPLVEVVRAHLERHVGAEPDDLLFPATGGGYLSPSSLYKRFYPAREAIGRPDLHWHDLRHTGATLAASTGAPVAAVMRRTGHEDMNVHLSYNHPGEAEDRALADALGALMAGAPNTWQNVVPIESRRRTASGN